MIWSSRKDAELAARFENAFVHPTAEIAPDVEIGPFCFIGPECRVGEGTRLHNHVTLVANVTLGAHNEVFPSAVIGGLPQDKKYDGEDSRLVIGDHNVIRECVTISTGTKLGGGLTQIGNRNLIMASCHIAHDCILEDDIVVANNVLLGGHVKVESFASFGGLAAVHHFVTVGRHAFVGGPSVVTQDVPPFITIAGQPCAPHGINSEGLKRRGFTPEQIRNLKNAYRVLYRSDLKLADAVSELKKRAQAQPELGIFVDFIGESTRSLVR